MCRVKEFNDVHRLKLGWSATTVDSQWATLFHARYVRHSSIYGVLEVQLVALVYRRDSNPCHLFFSGVANGLSISLWFDRWINNELILFRFPDIQFSAIDSIADIVCRNSWRIPFHLSLEINDLLYQATRHILVDDILAPETLSWQGNSTGTLFLKEAWNLLRSHATEIPWSDLIWNPFVNSHFASLSWHLLQRKTSTQSLAKKRGSSVATPDRDPSPRRWWMNDYTNVHI